MSKNKLITFSNIVIDKDCNITKKQTDGGNTNYILSKQLFELRSALLASLNKVYPDKILAVPRNETISDNAYSYQSELKALLIPYGQTSIGRYAFSNCTGIKNLVIPSTVKTIGNGAFNGCSSLTSITLCNGINSIGSSAFYECSSLTSVVIPDSVTTMNAQAFLNCSALVNVIIGKSLTSIPAAAFGGCTKLKTVTIPKSVTTIGTNAFYNTSLNTINFTGTEAQWNSITKAEGALPTGVTVNYNVAYRQL